MKKLIAVLLSFLLAFSVAFSVGAQSGNETDESPIIMIAGFMQTSLYTDTDSKSVWLPGLKDVIPSVLKNMIKHLPSLKHWVLMQPLIHVIAIMGFVPDSSQPIMFQFYHQMHKTYHQ